jgi:hypothetical protein
VEGKHCTRGRLLRPRKERADAEADRVLGRRRVARRGKAVRERQDILCGARPRAALGQGEQRSREERRREDTPEACRFNSNGVGNRAEIDFTDESRTPMKAMAIASLRGFSAESENFWIGKSKSSCRSTLSPTLKRFQLWQIRRSSAFLIRPVSVMNSLNVTARIAVSTSKSFSWRRRRARNADSSSERISAR